MALQKNMSVVGTQVKQCEGIKFPEEDVNINLGLVYIKVIDVKGNKTDISFNVDIKSMQGSLRRSYMCKVDLNGPNYIKQAYLHLKTLPEYSDAQDC